MCRSCDVGNCEDCVGPKYCECARENPLGHAPDPGYWLAERAKRMSKISDPTTSGQINHALPNFTAIKDATRSNYSTTTL